MTPVWVVVTAVYAAMLGWIVFLADTGAVHPGVTLSRWIPAGDKIAHAVLFGILAVLADRSLGGRTVSLGSGSWKRPVSWGCLAVLGLVVVEECSQVFFATRTFDAGDLLANVLGIGGAARIVAGKTRSAERN